MIIPRLAIVMSFVMVMIILPVAPAHAQELLAENFEQNIGDWAITPGRGSAQITTYADNSSLQLVRDAAAVRSIALSGVIRIDIAASFAASGLEGNDSCLIEFSPDGQSWYEIGRIKDGRDDGLSLHPLSGTVDIQTGTDRGYIGVRVAGNADNDICWVDNIRVVARPSPSDLSTIIPDQSFDRGTTPDRPFSTDAFNRPGDARQPTHRFSGRLRSAGAAMSHFTLLKDDFDYAASSQSIRTLPPFAIELMQIDDELVPLVRTPIAGSHPDWEWIFAPGKVWDDPADKGMTRAVLPFALMERNANCIHNGLASFRFDSEGTISHFVYQIGSETCAYTQFDAWGAMLVTYVPQPIAHSEDLVTAYHAEKAARLEMRSIDSLPSDVADMFGSEEEVAPDAMTAFGYIADGIHYTGGCETRFGSYLYCDSLVLPSYSWAKSLAAGIGAMRLEKLHPGAMQSLISDHVPACTGARWRGVTFADALNMATGVYNSDGHEVDEQSADMRSFFLAASHAEKIKTACTAFDRQQEPGEKFVYRTGDTYILGTAINAFLRKKTGNPAADYYADLLEPMWRELGMSPLIITIRRTYDSERQPFSGWGMTLLRNDIALVTTFLQRGGTINGEPMLDKKMLNAALQRDPQNRGLRAVIDAQRYQSGFWAWNAGSALGCKGDVWIPALSGFGGLSAALMPNGPVYYYVSDGGAFAWRNAARASNRLHPFCE